MRLSPDDPELAATSGGSTEEKVEAERVAHYAEAARRRLLGGMSPHGVSPGRCRAGIRSRTRCACLSIRNRGTPPSRCRVANGHALKGLARKTRPIEASNPLLLPHRSARTIAP